MNASRHVTYRKLKPWPPLDDFMAMKLPDRIAFIRKNLATKKKGGRIPYMTLDEFAEAVGATGRHRPIGWEKGQTPRDYAAKIAALTPYPPGAVGGDEEEEVEEATTARRLRSLEDELRVLRRMVVEGFALLGLQVELEADPESPVVRRNPQAHQA